MRRRASLSFSMVVFLICAAVLSVVPIEAGEEPVAPAMARITDLTAASAYIDAGMEEGLREGDAIDVMRGGQSVATLKVVFASTHRSTCAITSSTVALKVGDLVRYAARLEVPAPASSPALASEQPPALIETREETVAPAMGHVTYMTASSIYIDAGLEEGIQEGDEVEVMRSGQSVATLKVTFLSAHRASCAIVRSTVTLEVGDLVRYVVRPRSPSPAPETSSAQAATTPPLTEYRGTRSTGGPHGRVGVRYLVVSDTTGGDNGFSQPALDLRLDWSGMGGSPLDLALDVRARRTYRTLNDGSSETDNQNRVYRAAVSFHQTGSRQRFTLGRQFTPELAALSLLDGLVYELDGPRVGGGLFAGMQPDDVDLGYSGQVRETGGYLHIHNRAEASRHWSITTGLIGSYTEGTVNREFLYVQGQYSGSRLSAYLAQEVDYNRDWKVDEAEEDTVSPTSTFANIRYKAAEWLSVYGGYDNRRSVRLYRDRITPVTEFDDSNRRGYWSGAAMRFGDHFQGNLDARFSDSDSSGGADSYGLSVGLVRYTRMNLGFRARSTRFTNDRSEGWLNSLSAGLDVMSRCHLEISGGRMEETDEVDPTLDRTVDWYGVDLDLSLGKSWFLVLSAERNDSTFDSNDQAYASVTWRF